MAVLWLLTLLVTTQGHIIIRSLQDATLYAENLGTTKLYDYTWEFIIGIDTSGIDQRFQYIRESYDKADGLCTGCAEEFELKALRRRVYRLEELMTTLQQILGFARSKREILNAIGSISKTLFGTLNEDDMKLINKEFDKLYSDNRVMAETLGNQNRIMKTWISSASHDLQLLSEHSESHIKQLNDIINTTNTSQKSIVVGNIIAICAMAVGKLSEDLNLLINAINGGKHGIIHPQILTPNTLISKLRKIEEDLNTKYPVKLVPQNYRHIIDILEISIGIINNRLIYIYISDTNPKPPWKSIYRTNPSP